MLDTGCPCPKSQGGRSCTPPPPCQRHDNGHQGRRWWLTSQMSSATQGHWSIHLLDLGNDLQAAPSPLAQKTWGSKCRLQPAPCSAMTTGTLPWSQVLSDHNCTRFHCSELTCERQVLPSPRSRPQATHGMETSIPRRAIIWAKDHECVMHNPNPSPQCNWNEATSA